MTQFTRWQETKLDTVKHSKAYLLDTLANEKLNKFKGDREICPLHLYKPQGCMREGKIMKTIDIYKQYFSAECIFNGVERRAASVWLTAESDSGMIRYEVGVTFFPHEHSEDFAISYDACILKELVHTQGRRSKKRDKQYLEQVQAIANEIAASLNGTIYWEKPLCEAQYG